MTESDAYALPDEVEPPLADLHGRWKRLLRGGNSIPFWDDVKLSALRAPDAELILIDVFEKPQRFRFNFQGSPIADHQGRPVSGKFFDELDGRGDPFDHFEAQCGETVRCRAPTYYRHRSGKGRHYARIMLPLWGNGRIDMLLAGVTKAGG